MAIGAGTSSGPSAEINVTPLIDVLLVLLIIFMVIVPVTARGLDSSLPQETKNAHAVQPTLVELRAGAKPGEEIYRVNRREVARDAVGPALRSIFAAQPERTVYVQADRTLTYEPVARIVAEARKAGAGNVTLSAYK